MLKILYVSGTRADFGLIKGTLSRLHRDDELDLGVVATGMHLVSSYGETLREIVAEGFDIVAKVPVELAPSTGATMAIAIGEMTSNFAKIFERHNPDIVLILGDRGEMLAAAIAAIHQDILVAHIHGGERSGTIDEPVRHAISKLSHLHFTSTKEAAQRLLSMGEETEKVFVTGAPGLDEIYDHRSTSRIDLWSKYGLKSGIRTALMVFHPVTHEMRNADTQTIEILNALRKGHWQVVLVEPNADAGSDAIRAALDGANDKRIIRLKHIPRHDFLSFMEHVEVMVGNSSAGIIEAASFGTPVINVGTRQSLRERNSNIMDVEPSEDEIFSALEAMGEKGKFEEKNIYGNGEAGRRIHQLLKSKFYSVRDHPKMLSY
ncbi:UDP-N-acetylglucosamine 2-epimerase [Maritalea sp. S77]|uniref:UDP-N-acetylglucosamine 2-epimerase n=1 Tax=Maritalea sp. S77 TaxID=3415125 RepID=UPI003C7DB3AB